MKFHPGRIHINTLLQTEYWVDVTGRVIPIATIDIGYALNILQFLLKRSKALAPIIIWNSPDFYDDYGDKNWYDFKMSAEDRVMDTPIAKQLRRKILEAGVSAYLFNSPDNPPKSHPGVWSDEIWASLGL